MGHKHRGHAGRECGCGHHGGHGRHRSHGSHAGSDCGCGHRGHQSGQCGCGGQHGLKRRFWSREEKTAWLEQYLEDLENEAQAVRERLAKIKEG
jgi:hypothetical protein